MIVVAVASGTSVDALDVGLVDLSWEDGGGVAVQVLDTWQEEWPQGLASRLLALLPPAMTTAAELCALDTEVGRAVAKVAVSAAARTRRLTGEGPSLVVSPGQTVHHEVVDGRCLGTLQLGQPAFVAEQSGLPVISDLRARDVAAGGHGAPLASTLDQLWLAGEMPTAALNLGGIANVTVVRHGTDPLAWDTGPANCLLDVAATRATGGALRFDAEGALAAEGAIHGELLERLLSHPHFRLTPPVSTGRETFSAAWLDDVLAAVGGIPWVDVLATLTELTARTVADGLRPHAVTEVVVSGGGAANPTLMKFLQRNLGDVRLVTSDERGIPAAGKEVVLWALLGFLSWYGVPGTTGATGARGARILGRLSPGDRPLHLPPSVSEYPSHLRVLTRKAAR